ncbi:head decoration protein [Bradyrhizobium manausense]|uniref:head decoration protein n=1 Tax=Bradyrhizobium manausense TaxID=989370 RepID=UPI001BAB92A5|nr:head decoration protein [Bradyrhizobium manausense]MBR0687337.1 head decoration protein [Bradyrhizobium manausense]
MTLQNRIRAGGYIQSEANPFLSRDQVTIEGGTGGAGKVYAGTVLGQITATGKYVPWAHGASDGSQNAKAILWDDVDATASDVLGAVTSRESEVRKADLTFDATANGSQINAAIAALAAFNIIVRT